jgi:SAM-dependent methyltransferase
VTTTPPADYWNHNVHYQRLVLDAVPPGCGPAVDVGCGDGLLAARLAGRCATVTGVDRDGPMIAAARARAIPSATFVEADFLSWAAGPGSFDFACAVTALHHMDLAAALAKMASLVRPGGRVAVVGLADNQTPADWVVSAAGVPLHRWLTYTRGYGEPGAPLKDPGMSWAEARTVARRVLPGVRYRRHLLWRYSLVWDKPQGPRVGPGGLAV